MIDKTLIEKLAQDDFSFIKRQYKFIYQKDFKIRYRSMQNFVRRTICK